MYPPRVYFPVLCKFWHLYGGVNGNLLQEGLCHTQVCFTQSPCPCSTPLLTRTTTGDTQTQFCLSLCGVPQSWCTEGLFEPSEHLWQEWGLILNANLPLLLSPLPLAMGYLLTATPVPTMLLGYLLMAVAPDHGCGVWRTNDYGQCVSLMLQAGCFPP